MKPLKILHTSDWHLGKMLGRFSRLPEQKEFLEELVSVVYEKKPHIVLISGDIFDNYNPPIEALELFYSYIKKLSENGKRIIAIIAGNHDSPDRLNAPYPLAIEHGILLAGYPETRLYSFELRSRIKGISKTLSSIELYFPDLEYTTNLLFTAYANEARMREFVQQNEEKKFSIILEDYWKTKAKLLPKVSVNILLAHAFVAKRNEEIPEEPEDEKSILSVGGAEIVYTEQIPENLQYVALGHLHKFNALNDFIIYSGSPLSYSFKEAEQKKFLVYAEIYPNSIPKLETIPVQAGIPLVKKTFNSAQDAIKWLESNRNIYVEIYLELDEFLKSEDHRKLREAHPRLVQIVPILNAQNTNTHWRNSIDLTQTIEELFIKYFEYKKGQKPSLEILEEFREIQRLSLEE